MRADPCPDPANFGVTLLQPRADVRSIAEFVQEHQCAGARSSVYALDAVGVAALWNMAQRGPIRCGTRPRRVWLEAGVHIKAVADLLGDSSISITGDIYGHTSGETARSAVYGWSGVLGL